MKITKGNISRKPAHKTGLVTSGERKLFRFVRKHFSIPLEKRLSINTQLDQLDNSSHGIINFTFEFEKQFDIELTDKEAERLETHGTVQHLIAFLKQRKN
jgi:acyl carrier protein